MNAEHPDTTESLSAAVETTTSPASSVEQQNDSVKVKANEIQITSDAAVAPLDENPKAEAEKSVKMIKYVFVVCF
jgi:hypothetical protein